LGAEFDALIMGAIEKETDLRFQTAVDFRSACRRAERALGAGAKDRAFRTAVPGWYLHLRPRTLGICATAAAVAGLLLYQNRPSPDPTVIDNVQITAGEPVNAFVNDGGRLYYSAGKRDANTPFFEVSTAGGAAREIPSLRGMIPLDISPDRSEILMGKAGTPGAKPLWVASVLGNAPRRLDVLVATGARWSSRGDKIVYTAGQDVRIAAADGSNPRTLFKLRASGQITSPFFLDADTKVRFHIDEDGAHAVWQINADRSGFRPLLPHWHETGLQADATISVDGRSSLFVGSNNDLNWDLWTVREGRRLFALQTPQPFRLTAGPLTVAQPQFAPSGHRIFYLGKSRQTELVRFDPAPQDWKPILQGMNAFQVEYSRDRNWIAYVAPPGQAVWRSRADGSEAIQLTSLPLMPTNPRLSPDNRTVVFWGSLKGQTPGMYLVSATGGPVERLTAKGRGADRETEPTWSPDGRSVLYGAQQSLWIINMATRETVRLPNSEGLRFPRWSWDGKYAAAPDAQSRLWIYDVAAQRRVLLTSIGAGYPIWSRDNNFIYFENHACSTWYRVNVTTHEVSAVANLIGLHIPEAGLGWMGLTPDGATISARELSSEQIYAMDWDPR
jgi:Tol biopolymer transport system component